MPYPMGNETVVDAPAKPIPRLVWHDDEEPPKTIAKRITRAQLAQLKSRRKANQPEERARRRMLMPALRSARANGMSTQLIAAAYDLPEASVRYLLASKVGR